MKTVLSLAVLSSLIAACASAPTSNSEVARIQASCDNKSEDKTVINGHAYFCDDYAHFSQQMQAIAKALQSRGI